MLLASAGSYTEYVPAGYTSKLQVLDVGINKPFKDYMRKQYSALRSENPDPQAKVKVERSQIANWVVQAWSEITPVTIINTWRKVLKGDLDA